MNIESQITNTQANLNEGFGLSGQNPNLNDGTLNFKEEFGKLASSSKDEHSSFLKAHINFDDSLNDDLKSIEDGFNFNSISIDKNDAAFIINVVQQANNNSPTKSEEILGTQKTMDVSKTLFNLLEKASTTNKPIRLDFDNNVTVILKYNKSGEISANFIPGDKAVEEYLRNNIPYLKQRFDEQNISYKSLNYQQSKNNNNNKNKGES